MSNEMNLTGSGIIGIQGVSGSTVNVTQIIGKSGEYRELEDQLNTLQKLFDRTPESETQERLELSEKIGKQKTMVESFRQDILKLAETFDKIELNTERLQKAKAHFDKGEITEARVLLEDAEEERSDFVAHALDKKKEYEEKYSPGLQNAATEYLILAQATALDFGSPSRFEDTCRYYEQSIAAHTSFDNLRAYGSFLSEHRQYSEAIAIYERVKTEFTSESDPINYAGTLNSLGDMYLTRNEVTAAEREFQEALRVTRELAAEFPAASMFGVATLLNNLANLHSDQNMLDEAEKEFSESLNIWRELAAQHGKDFLVNVTRTLTNLGELHRRQNQPEAAEKELTEGLELLRQLAAEDRQAYLPYMAITLNNLAALHYNLDELDQAEKELSESLEIREELAKKNPQAYLPDVAKALNNLGELHRKQKQHAAAETELGKALEIWGELAAKDRQTYLPDAANTLGNLAVLHVDRGEFDKAEEELRGSLNIYLELEQQNPLIFKPHVAHMFGNFAVFYQSSKPDKEKSITVALEAVRILIPFMDSAPYTEQYLETALGVLNFWGMSNEEILAQVQREPEAQ